MCQPCRISLNWWAPVLGLFVQSSMYLGIIKSLGIYFKELHSSLGTTTSDLGLILGLYSGFVYMSAPVFTHMFQYGKFRRCILVAGAVLSSVTLVLGSIASDNIQLALCLSFTGIGGCILSMCCVICVEEVDAQNFHLLYGLGKSGFAFGMILVPLLAEYLTDIYGWRGSMVITGAMFGNLIPLAMLIRGRKNRSGCVTVDTASSRCHISRDIKFEEMTNVSRNMSRANGDKPTLDLDDCFPQKDRLQHESDVSICCSSNGSTSANTSDFKDTHDQKRHPGDLNTCRMTILQSAKDTISQLRRQWMHVFIPASTLGGMVGGGWHSFLIPRTVSTGVPLSSAINILYPAAIACFLGRFLSGLLHKTHLIPTLDLYLLIKALDAVSLLADVIIKPYPFKFVTSFVNAFCIAEANLLIVFVAKERTTPEFFPLTIACVSVSYGFGSLVGTYLTGLIAELIGSYTLPFLLLAACDVLVVNFTIPARYHTPEHDETT